MAKVLLVEDDNNLREIYQARLQAEGYEISSAQDGEQALVVAKEFKPDLIISDVMMPKISGFEMLDILRNTAGLENTRVIMLTALSQAEDQTRADSLGADRYLVKSQVTLEDIIKAAHDILDGGDSAPAADTSAVPAPASEPVATPTPQVAAPPVVEETMPVASAPSAPVEAPATESEAATAVTPPEPAPTAPAAPTANSSVASEPPTTPEPTQDSVQPAVTTGTDSNDNPATASAQTVPAATPDDALLAEAATSLGGTTEAAAPPVAPQQTETAAAPSSETQATTEATTNNDDGPSQARKVIQPLSGDEIPQKPNLDELLAKEEAKEAAEQVIAQAAAQQQAPNPASNSAQAPNETATPPAQQPTDQKPDTPNPHDIAL